MKNPTSLLILIIIIIIISLPLALKFKKQRTVTELEPAEEVKMTRTPAVAGAFYPADKTTLINQINGFLEKAEIAEEEETLRILILPHAGYDYSGQTAAWGFKQLEKQNYSKVIILGASHRTYFQEAAVYNQGSWQTPLGEVNIDEELTNSLINQSGLIKANLAVHEQEHSLEVELPFLQKMLTDFEIVPILLGHSNKEVLEVLAEAISNNFDGQTLLVISSDLSHYPEYEVANKVDKETIDAILTGEVDEFSQKIEENLDQSGVETCACGADAIKVAMMVAKKIKSNKIKLLNYTNSGDTGGDKSRAVGYASIGFYGEVPKIELESGDLLNKEQQVILLKLSRETLESYLKDKKIPEFKTEDEVLNQKLGAFVTLRKHGELRGCIGEFEPKDPLYKVVQSKVIDAALHDSRFSPVTFNELEEIEIEVSVLSKPQKTSDWKKIIPGKHGVIVKKGMRGGTFLPQVATENNWDLKTFLSNLCSHKAGLSEDCYKDPSVELLIYTAQVFSEEEKN